MNTIRMEIWNATRFTATDIKIDGAYKGHIDKLAPGEHETIWLKIIGDGSIEMNYLTKGNRRNAVIIEYTCSWLGEKST